MSGGLASKLFLAICIALAVLLLTRTITPLVSGSIFAVALVLLGGLSHGFKKGKETRPASGKKE